MSVNIWKSIRACIRHLYCIRSYLNLYANAVCGMISSPSFRVSVQSVSMMIIPNTCATAIGTQNVEYSHLNLWKGNAIAFAFFPSFQVRVVRFYQSCSSPPLPPPPSSSFSSSASSSSSTTSASTSTSTVALPTLGQALRQLRSSVRTAGPQPGTFLAQRALLDLNLGPSEISAHRWTSKAR